MSVSGFLSLVPDNVWRNWPGLGRHLLFFLFVSGLRPVVAFWNNLLLDYWCKFLNDNAIRKMRDVRLPVFMPNLNLTDCPNYLIMSG